MSRVSDKEKINFGGKFKYLGGKQKYYNHAWRDPLKVTYQVHTR